MNRTSRNLPAKAQDKKADTRQLVTLDGKKPVVTSLMVAEKFGKRHNNVLRDIQRMECSDEFRRLNFEQSSYVNEQNKEQPMVVMTRDGFAILAMGFTGKEAMVWKEKFIAEFNRLERIVHKVLQQPLDPNWGLARQEGKYARRTLTDVIRDRLIPASINEGSTNGSKLYMTYSKMLIKALFEIEEQPDNNLRECLSTRQLRTLEMAENRLADIIERSLDEGMGFRDVYQVCKEWANDQYAPVVGGKSKVVTLELVVNA